MPYALFILLCLSLTSKIYARKEAEPECSLGNFAVPPSQQPGPLISFGENILYKNTLQVFLFADDYIDKNQYFIDVVPSFLYAITDNFSVFFNVPVVAFKKGRNHSYGLGDIPIQFEYAYYNKGHTCSSDLATIVANVTIPTGSSNKQPPTGFGAPSFFIGATYNHTTDTWFYFTSYGAVFTTTHHRTKFGNQYLYQFGIGRNIVAIRDWVYAWVVEFDGTFYERDRLHGTINPNSGGNLIYVTPSLSISSQHIMIQFGFGFAAQQHLFGHQPKSLYLLAGSLGWTF